jgi:KaiC/GvpD/RAD55 family RecA-like ATPase
MDRIERGWALMLRKRLLLSRLRQLDPVLMATVREMVESFKREIRDTDLQPDRAADLLVKLTALMGNCNDQIREADADYATILLSFLEANEAANRARIRAETTPAFQKKREARDTKELVVELCRSLKYLLKSNEEAMRLAR